MDKNISIKSNSSQVDLLLQQASDLLSSDIPKSLEVAKEANLIAQKHLYTKGIAESLKQMALSCQYATNYVEAMKYSMEAKDIFNVIDDKKGEAACLNILGAVYNFLGDYNKRLACNLECLKLREETNDQRAVLSSLNNIGDTYLSMKDFKNALKYFNDCLQFENLEDDILAIVKYNIAEVYFHQGDYELSLNTNEEGLKYAEASNYYAIQSAAYTLFAQINLKQNNIELAIEDLNKGLEVLSERESLEQEVEIYQLMSEAFAKQQKYDLAYEFIQKHISLRDKILNENSSQQMKKIEFDAQLKNITTEAQEIKEKNELLTKAFTQIEAQANEIRDKNRAITDSIHYARRIQYAILPEEEKVKKCLQDYFIFYQPKDIVSGDFYWVERVDDYVVFAVVDCTGHGVPGAFMSLIANNALNKIVLEKKNLVPGDIANDMNDIINELFQRSEEQIRDGMDMGICSWNKKNNTLQFSGAFNSLFIYRKSGELEEVKGNRESVGASIYQHKRSKFNNHNVDISQGDTVYISSDGLPDQFGGKKGKKLKWKGLKQMLESVADKPMQEQGNAVQTFFNDWRKNVEQLDDVCIMGVKF